MRIALVYRALNVSGSLPRFHVELARYFVRRGHDVHVFSMANRSDPSLVPGSTFHAVPVRHRAAAGYSATELLGFAWSVEQLLKQQRFDVVHVRAPSSSTGDVLHVPGVIRGEAELMELSTRRLAVNLLRRPGNFARYAIEQRALRFGRFRRFHAEAPLVRDHLTHFYAVDPQRILVIPPGVNLDEFKPASDRARTRMELGIVAESPVILFCGHDFRRKGLDIAIEAVARSRTRATLLVVGAATDEEKYRQLALERGVGHRVLFLGSLDNTPRLYQAADLFVLPTRADIWGATVVEAMACAVPPIVSSAAGAASIVENGATGIVLSAPVDVQSLRDAMDHLAEKPALRIAMGEAAARRAASLSWDVHGQIVEADLLEIAEEKKR